MWMRNDRLCRNYPFYSLIELSLVMLKTGQSGKVQQGINSQLTGTETISPVFMAGYLTIY